MMKIYRNNTEIVDIRPQDNSTQRVVHMGEDVLNLTFKTTAPLDLRVNDYVYFQDVKYKLKRPPNPVRKCSYEYEYTSQWMSPQYDLQDALYLLEDSTGVGVLDENIPINGTLSFHLAQIVKCLKEVHPEWVVGDVEETGESKLVEFNEMDCLQALQHLASEFNTEYWIRGTSISMGKNKYGNPLEFKCGKGNALYELSRQNQEGRIVTALRVRGSDRNIDVDGLVEKPGYGNKYLLLPGKERYVYKNVEKYGTLHGRMNFPEVYPRLIHKNPTDPGSITSVRVNEKGHYFIKDKYLNFDPKKLPDSNIVVDFQSGQLNGLKIDANWHQAEGAEKGDGEFELIQGDYGLSVKVPNGKTFVPNVGDRYLLSNILMPPEYIEAAEKELKEKAEEALAQMCEQKVSYKGVVNPLYFRLLGEKIETGRAVVIDDPNIVDNNGRVELRIQSFTRNVNDDLSLDIEISDTIYVSRIDKIETAIQENKGDTEQKIRYGDAYTRRRFRDAQELYEYLKKSQLNFTEAINPIAIHSMQAFFGDVNLQFRFVNSTTNPVEIDHPFTYSDQTKMFNAPASIIQHMTLGIETTSPSHKITEYSFWHIALKTEPVTDTEARWIYLKCSKALTNKVGNGTIELRKDAIKMDPGDGFYYFLAGFLNSEFDGSRSLISMYGFTEITPGQIRVNKLVNPDGDQYWDMLNHKFRIGNSKSGISWNVDKPNQLVIKGTLIQSESGETSFAGVYRGVYNPTFTYYPGDEVSYTSNGSTSTYRYKDRPPGAGRLPTNDYFWQVIAEGAKGTDGDYFEYRYAISGSRTSPPALSTTSTIPYGWNTQMPYVSPLQYIWCTVAKKSASGELLQNWSTPTRITGSDGKDGAKGDTGPTVVYRGFYDYTKTYYGTSKRVDCVKHDGTYYIACVNGSSEPEKGFANVPVNNTQYWNTFGAQFESVATNLLLAEKATIGDWYHDKGTIVSVNPEATDYYNTNKITLDATGGKINVESLNYDADKIDQDYSIENRRAEVLIDATRALVQTKSKVNNNTAYISPSGIFCNNAETDAVSAVQGVTHKAAIVGLGNGMVNKGDWHNENFIAGVYGRASNDGKAPAYGGFFQNLMAAGLFLHTKVIDINSPLENDIEETNSLVIGYHNSVQKKVILPSDGVIGRVIFFKQWGTGYMRILPKSGHILYDDHTPNSYLDIGHGEFGILVFTNYKDVNNKEYGGWLFSSFKFY